MLSKLKLLSVILLALTLLINIKTKAQTGKLFPFQIMRPNGKIFIAQNLPYEKPIVIIYFSPDCEDCLSFMDKFFDKVVNFKKVSVVMISYLPIEEVTKFAVKYKTANYKNIIVGTEGSSFLVKDYYKITEIPFLALYDKNGNIQCSYQKNIPLNDIIAKLQKL